MLTTNNRLSTIWFKELIAWNQKYIMTAVAVDDFQKILYDQVVPCATMIREYCQAHNITTVIDVGSGCGTPGLVIADLVPDLQVHLVEHRNSRASFLSYIVAAAQLTNVTVHHINVSDFKLPNSDAPAVITMRAFFPLQKALQHTLHLFSHPQTRLIKIDNSCAPTVKLLNCKTVTEQEKKIADIFISQIAILP